jgi:formiminotetrahydrofolate cyclodeaminase
MAMDSSATIEAFLAATAARQPTPGGGSVAALAGALAAALAEMVTQYSVGKKDLAAHQAELKAALAEFARARRLLLGLMAEDQAAYAALSDARKHPESPEFAAALTACLSAPQAVAATGVAVLELCDRLAGKINPHLRSDLAICADLCMATVRCSTHNVRVNLSDVTDPARRSAIEQSSRKTLAHALEIIQRFSRRSS